MLKKIENGLEVVRGTIRNLTTTQNLINALKDIGAVGTLYAGYPIIASAETAHTIEAMLISPEYGLVAFTLTDINHKEADVKELQDKLFYLIQGNLGKHESLRNGRLPAITPSIIAFYEATSGIPKSDHQYRFANQKTLKAVLKSCEKIPENAYRPLCASIQRVSSIKPIKKRENVSRSGSRGWIIKEMEKEIANLDQHQKKAAIEAPEGPQRVRGLAGSGKTVVLALKAAYLHAQNPQWDIVVTFHTRSLNQQFRDLIERFTLEHSGDKPNWEKLQIRHAWGSSSEPGVYSDIAEAINIAPVNFANAKLRYGNLAFEGICNELLMHVNANSAPKLYDCVIVDEAQDLPRSFFGIVHSVTRNPKRIVWAYDELQSLSNSSIPGAEELFGKTRAGKPRVSLRNDENEAQQDIILPVCYRNTPWALTLAHALGFGIYRKQLVQLFDKPQLWEDVGYTVESGNLETNQDVTLKRASGSYPKYFTNLLKPEDAVLSKIFKSEEEQYDWIAKQIHQNLTKDELDPDDILIIFPNAITAKSEYILMAKFLSVKGISSHLAGVSTDRDVFSRSNSVTASSIFRAKGNEAPMVYIVNAECCANGHEMIKLRNILFTSITRSRAWVRICGVGSEMEELEKEITAARDNDYKLTFHVPTKEQLAKLRLINRDRTDLEKSRIVKTTQSIREIEQAISSGILNPDASPELQGLLRLLQKRPPEAELYDEEE